VGGHVTPNVLVVDDEPSITTTMAAVLEQEGYAVHTAASVAEGRVAIRARPVDLLLTDLRLDDGTGLDLLSELRGANPDAVTVILTGYASLDSAVEALRGGAYDYLIKPCPVDELKATVAHALERRSISLSLKQRLTELDTTNTNLQTFAIELTQRVDQLTGELRQKIHELSEASRAREEFIGMAAHELRTPLTSLLGWGQYLQHNLQRGSQLDEEGLGRISRRVEQQVQKMSQLVSRMLETTQIENGMLAIDIASVDLVPLVHDAVESEQIRVPGHQITVHAPATLEALVDPLRFDQIVTNLVDNALKYSPDDCVIEVELRDPVETEAQVVELVVRDHGPGIPLGAQSKVFERFHRVDTDQNRAGLGLGLYVVRRLVEAHGGTIMVETPEDGGARFVVRIPGIAGAQAAARERAS
jgi:signal transduction histidine kinase